MANEQDRSRSAGRAQRLPGGSRVRITINMGPETAEAVKKLADEMGISDSAAASLLIRRGAQNSQSGPSNDQTNNP